LKILAVYVIIPKEQSCYRVRWPHSNKEWGWCYEKEKT